MEVPKTRFNQLLFQKYLTLAACCFWLLFCLMANEVPTDIGDGLQHFFISEASWSNPILFLDHWGKPLFIFLSSPFAQFGFIGMGVFQILVFLLSIWIAWKIMDKLRVNPILQLTFPFILLFTYDFTSTILGGLTEPLFNLFLLFAAYCLLQKKWMGFALIISCFPFLRSEGQFVLVLGLFILIYVKAYKSIPYLFVASLLYAIIGWIALDDFFWYINNSPYEIGNDIYGHGSWDHYLMSYKNYLGNVGLFVFLIALVGLVVKQFILKKKISLNMLWLVFGYATFFIVLIIHSYFWANGLSGSAGLTRIATQGMPLFVLVNVYLINTWIPTNFKIPFQSIFANGLLVLLFLKLASNKYFPTRAHANESSIIETAKFVQQHTSETANVYYFHPLFAFQMGGNPFKKDSRFKIYYCEGLEKDIHTRFLDGDILVRDSWFGPQESNFPLSEIKGSTQLKQIGYFPSSIQIEDRFNEEEGLCVYQVIKK